MHYFEVDLNNGILYLSREAEQIVPASANSAFDKLIGEMKGTASEGSAFLLYTASESQKETSVKVRWEKLYDQHGRQVKAIGSLEPENVENALSAENPEEELKTLRMLVAEQNGYLEKSEKYLKELRRYRHDRKNNLIAVCGLLDSGDIDGAKKYLASLVGILYRNAPLINTGNPAIDLLVTTKLLEAKKAGIEIKQVIGLQEHLEINLKDLCLAIGCCFDNAIEACITAKTKFPNPVISYQLLQKHGMILFKMTNTSITPFHSDMNEVFTSKKDAENHGFGLINIRDVAENNGGYFEVLSEDNSFTIHFTVQVS